MGVRVVSRGFSYMQISTLGFFLICGEFLGVFENAGNELSKKLDLSSVENNCRLFSYLC